MLDADEEIRQRFRAMRDRKFESMRIRCHGNYDLAQLLYTGKDFVITDFEGDSRISLSERRAKYSPTRDVGTMLRSFHHAAYAALLASAEGTLPAGRSTLEPWYRFWHAWVPTEFLRAYLAAAANAVFMPADTDEFRILLEIRLLQESLAELWYEIQGRATWARVPLQGILQLLHPAGQAAVAT